MSNTTIILIGPMCAGKSSVATELSKSINIPQVPMDRVRWYYYLKDGYDFVKEQELHEFSEKIKYWKPFEVKAVQRILKEFAGNVIDFGAGHSFFTDRTQFREVELALKEFPHVILLLPTEDKQESLDICCARLKVRTGRDLEKNEIDANRDFIFHESNYKLAKHIVYSKNKTVAETVSEIKEIIEL